MTDQQSEGTVENQGAQGGEQQQLTADRDGHSDANLEASRITQAQNVLSSMVTASLQGLLPVIAKAVEQSVAAAVRNTQGIQKRGANGKAGAHADPPSAVGITGSETTRLAVPQLGRIAEELLQASLAESTRRTYGTAQAMFIRFCEGIGKPALPASEQLLILFVADLSQRLCVSSIRTYLSAVRHLHIVKGWGDPLKDKPQLVLALRGAKRLKPRAQDRRLPITPLVLQMVKGVLDRAPHDYDNLLMWAACCLGFFAFLRSGEFTVPSQDSYDPQWHLSVEDVEVDDRDSPSMLRVHIKGSKTDQTRSGVHLYIGKTDNHLCPVAAVLAYLAARGARHGPLFLLSNGQVLTRQRLVIMLRKALTEAGVECDRFSGHSFRIGAATTAAAKGVSEATIQTLGRWASDSYKRYIRLPRQQLASISRQLATE